MLEGFKIIGKIEKVEIIVVGRSIRILPMLNKRHGKGRWRKLKGIARVERISTGNSGSRRFTGMKPTGSAEETQR